MTDNKVVAEWREAAVKHGERLAACLDVFLFGG